MIGWLDENTNEIDAGMTMLENHRAKEMKKISRRRAR